MVIPVHNEEDLLPRTISSNYELGPDEVLWGLDRCTDKTREIILEASEAFPDTLTRLIPYDSDQGQGWVFRPAFLRRDLYFRAQNDTIFNTSADLKADPDIRRHLPLDHFKLLSFGYFDSPLNYQSLARWAISTSGLSHGMAGLLAVSRGAWLETEDLGALMKLERAEDTHLQMAVARVYPTRHINTRSRHLRPSETPRDHFNRGMAQWDVQRKGPLPVILHSLIMLRPRVLNGYIYARMRK